MNQIIGSNAFDIVILVGPNDKIIFKEQIKYTKKNIIGYRNIYLICYDPTINEDGCITINENTFPFNKQTVIKYHGESNRNGWYLQQLLKLYAGRCIPNILNRYLVIDCDTFFLKKTVFIKDNKCLYNFGKEYHKPYFEHMLKLDKNLIKKYNVSGICHHMMFENNYIEELILIIENNHNDYFYNIFLKFVTNIQAGASEYEIYFNYMLNNHLDKIEIRKLNYTEPDGWYNIDNINNNNTYYDYISYHHYRKQK